ncbi:hypothetical protein BS78_02G177300 [Paspalum vaginatum]|nr:hypothetical protein BS78_02G177300 [Paspalum vaginatum]
MRRARGAGRAACYAALWLLCCCASLAAVPRAGADLAADRAALLAFRAAVGPRLPWDASAASPCGWRGVRCDGAGAAERVVALQLPGASLLGAVPPGTVGNLTALRTLSLRLNALSGGIPADIGACAELRYLYLRGNRLGGEVPEGLFELPLLQRLDLADNGIGGGVSPGFNRLPRLATLYLENNRLNGTLPAGLELPKLALFNVSGNQNLTGAVPTSLAGEPASAFQGTKLCGGPLSPCSSNAPPSPSPPSPPPAANGGNSSDKLSAGAIAGIAAGGVVALLVAIAVLFLLCSRCRRTKAEKSAAEADADGSPPVSVTVASMDSKAAAATKRSSRATANNAKRLVFLGAAPDTPYDLESLLQASAEVIGKGWLGTTYRATLEGGAATVAVKRLRAAPIPEREFRDKVTALGALQHENLAPLRAYYYSREEKLLVYDFVGAGSLCTLLHGGGSGGGGASPARLDFTARVRIALAAARGVAFVHGAGARSWHGNIKSSNVLVTGARDGAYVTDHGLLQLVGAHVPLKRVTGYRAPEAGDPRRASREADVYSFGVLLLELLTGRPPANSVPGGGGGGVDLPLWVRTVVQEEWTAEVFDASIAVEERVEEEMVRLLQLATECTGDRPDRRPPMAEVAARIERIVESALLKADTDDDFHSICP